MDGPKIGSKELVLMYQYPGTIADTIVRNV